jgi:hypothetical protein
VKLAPLALVVAVAACLAAAAPGNDGARATPTSKAPLAAPVRCNSATVRAKLTAFVRAYNAGDLRRLDELFSRRRFVWYSSGRPGMRLNRAAENRATLIPYFRERHRRADRLSLGAIRFQGFASARQLGHFSLAGKRRAADFHGGRWFALPGKGALDCSSATASIAVLSLGGPRR